MEPNNFLNSDQQAYDPWAPQPDPVEPTEPAVEAAPLEPAMSSSLFGAPQPPTGDMVPQPPTGDMAPYVPVEATMTASVPGSFETPAGVPNMFDDSPMEPVPADEVHELVEFGPKPRKFEMKKMLGAGLAVAVLAAGSTVAFKQFTSSDGTSAAEGGANSPQLVVEEFMAAVEQEDFLGAAQMMEPAERRTLVNPGIEMVGELQRIGVLADEFDMSSVQGVDVQMGEMAYVPQPLASNVVRVGVTGDVTTVGTAGELPLGPLITDNVPAEELEAMAAEAPTTEVESFDDLGIVTVQRDGAWYVSLWYSVAEAVRQDEGIAEMPSFGNGPTPVGGATPEAAVQAMADAVSAFDPTAMIASLDPQEAAALYDYSTLFLAEAEAELAEIDEGAAFTINRLDMTSTTDGDDALVTIEGMAATINFFDETYVIDTAANCLVESTQRCEVDESMLAELGSNRDALKAQIAVHKVGDAWFISPTSTVMSPLLDAMADLDQAKIQGWIDNPESLYESGDMTTFGLIGPFTLFGLSAVTLIGSQAEATFTEIESEISGGEAWDDQGWEDGFDDDYEWDVAIEIDEDGNPIPSTTVAEPGFVLPDTVEVTTTQGPAEAPESNDTADGPVFTLPDTAIPTETTVPATTTTTTIQQIELVTVYQVQEFTAAGTSAFDIDADPVQIPVGDLESGSVTNADVQDLDGLESLVDLERGTILNWSHFDAS